MVNTTPVQLDEGTTYLIPISGTSSWQDIPARGMRTLTDRLWWKPGSRFTQYLAARGVLLLDADFPFQWTTNLSGILGRRDKRDWQAAGAHLRDRYIDTDYDKVNIIAHSHGGQVALFGCSYGLRVRNLITIGTPARFDMMKTAEAAKKRIGHWLSIADPDDPIRERGTWFDDGDAPLHYPYADTRDTIKGIAHSRVLYDTDWFNRFEQYGWISFLKMKEQAHG